MKLDTIAVDVDHVLADVTGVWIDLYNRNAETHEHDRIITCREAVNADWDFFPRICQSCFRQVLYNPDVVLQYPLMPDAYDALHVLNNFYDLVIVTHRYPAVADATRRWLREKGINDLFKTVDVFGGANKAESCVRLGACILVDDSPKVIGQFDGFTAAKVIVFDQPHNRGVDATYRAHGWKEVVEIALQLKLERWNAA